MKNHWRAGKKQIEALQCLDLTKQQIQPHQPQTRSVEDIFPKDELNQEALNELKMLLEIEGGVNRENLFYKTVAY